jgi:hypothetical protein
MQGNARAADIRAAEPLHGARYGQINHVACVLFETQERRIDFSGPAAVPASRHWQAAGKAGADRSGIAPGWKNALPNRRRNV